MDPLSFQRYAIATENYDPRIWNAHATVETQALQAPPLYVSAVMSWGAGPRTSDLRADGVGRTVLDELPLKGLRLMGGGQDLEFLSPVLADMVIESSIEIVNVSQKIGKSGTLIILETLTTYSNQANGDVLILCRERIIAR